MERTTDIAPISPLGRDRLLTSAEAAEYLRVTQSTLESWRYPTRKRPLPFVRVGRAVRYRKKDLDAFLDAGVVDPSAEAGTGA
ncbi:MAG: helix-turn-helix domain-containing protein [Candidatus Krumholzibacteriia bacterium]